MDGTPDPERSGPEQALPDRPDDAQPAPQPRPLLAGRYEVGPMLGVGATAQVHRAWDRDEDRAVAVKIFLPGSTTSPSRGGTWEREVLTGIRHDGLVAVHDCGVDAQRRPFVVMDLVDGHSLTVGLADGPLPPAAVARLGTVVADALAVVHARGVVHRDVKPANILLDADGRPRLTDFGIARLVDATRVTATGLVVGTAAYMAPEQVRGEAVGPAADVYALGLVLLEAITGRREYEGTPIESALARLHRRPAVPDDVPDPLGAVLHRATAPDPDERPTAADLAATLRAAVSAGESDAEEPAGGEPSRRRLVPAGALAVLVVAAVGGAAALTGADRSPAAPPEVAVPAAAPPVVAAPPAVPQVRPVPEQVGVAVAEAARRAPAALVQSSATSRSARQARPVAPPAGPGTSGTGRAQQPAQRADESTDDSASGARAADASGDASASGDDSAPDHSAPDHSASDQDSGSGGTSRDGGEREYDEPDRSAQDEGDEGTNGKGKGKDKEGKDKEGKGKEGKDKDKGDKGDRGEGGDE